MNILYIKLFLDYQYALCGNAEGFLDNYIDLVTIQLVILILMELAFLMNVSCVCVGVSRNIVKERV